MSVGCLQAFSSTHLIFADDEELFRDMAETIILEQGKFPENMLHLCQDGVEAEEELDKLVEKAPDARILMILDARMPRKGGDEVASTVKKLADDGKLARLPFLVCCSANNAKAAVQYNDLSNGFHMALPKSYKIADVLSCLEGCDKHWGPGATSTAVGSTARATKDPVTAPAAAKSPVASGGYASKPAAAVELLKPLLVVADDELICRMALLSKLSTCVDVECDEVDDEDMMIEFLTSRQNELAPIALLLGNPLWLDRVEKTEFKHKPYLVNTSMFPNPKYHVSLNESFTPAEITKVGLAAQKWLLEQIG